MTDQYTDGPNTHKYADASFVTDWTVLFTHELTDHGLVRHVFHVPTAALAPTREPSAEADAAHPLGACICDGCREGFALSRPATPPLDVEQYLDTVAYQAGWEDGQAALKVRPATPPLDVERLRQAIRIEGFGPDLIWDAVIDNIAARYAALAIPTPETLEVATPENLDARITALGRSKRGTIEPT